MTARDPAKPVRTTRPGDPPPGSKTVANPPGGSGTINLADELERGHQIIAGLEAKLSATERALADAQRAAEKAARELEAARKENGDLVVKVTNLTDRLDTANTDLATVREELATATQSRETAEQENQHFADDLAEAQRAKNEALKDAAGLRAAHAKFAGTLRDHQADAKRKLAAAAAELASKRYRGKRLVARHAEAKGRADALDQAAGRLP